MDIINLLFKLFMRKILSLSVIYVQILPLSSNDRKEIMEALKEILIKNEWFKDIEDLEKFWTKNKKMLECINNCDRPNKKDIFNAFDGLTPQDVKVLIVGQDPYPTEGRADGLAFSFGDNKPAKDSLKNIFDKIKSELNIDNKNTNLKCWRDRGVLFLNTALTYKKGDQDYHITSWSNFVDHIISKLMQNRTSDNPLVIMLWGGQANLLKSFRNDKKDSIYRDKHIYILRASHPSNLGDSKNYSGNFKSIAKKLECQPLSRDVKGFMDNKNEIFVESNNILKSNKIDWSTD